jgi:hypothetical protein
MRHIVTPRGQIDAAPGQDFSLNASAAPPGTEPVHDQIL